MSSTTLERLRSMHEDIENYERVVVSVLNDKTKNHRDRVVQGHRVSKLIDRIVERSQDALETYEDEDGLMKEENESMSDQDMFSSFYDRLKEIRDYHRKYPNVSVMNQPSMKDCMNPEIRFTGEERFGKYVDLHEFYTRFLNIAVFSELAYPDGKENPMDYISYLSCFNDMSRVKQSKKTQTGYKKYLDDLMAYLIAFYRRTQPLVDLDDVMSETTTRFEKDWTENKVPGWNATENETMSESALYCKPCKKLFASEGVFNSHLNGKKHKKAVNAANSVDQTATNPQEEAKSTALMEVTIRKMCELLSEVISATKSYVELKQTRTHEELQAEIEEEEMGEVEDIIVDEDDDDEESPLYNPLNLPLGWDGKPIPFWLYKLHGLGVEFKCEICGNHSYWGRRAFDRHFQEWRHAHGMRCLKIPNTKHFHDIVLIEDALNLYSKIRHQIDAETWRDGNEEECEDSQGNVMTKKTYEDMARQGLL